MNSMASVEEDYQGFGRFLIDLDRHLNHENKIALATVLDLDAAAVDKVKRDTTGERALTLLLQERGIISPLNIEQLKEALNSLELEGILKEVSKSFDRNVKRQNSSTLEEKRSQLLAQLKTKYLRLCGKIQHSPFPTRNTFDKLFVESKIEFRKEDGSRKSERWIQLKNYRALFTEPDIISSKRRILIGEPGCGKSTLALKIAHDWCQEISPMNNFQVLVLLHLRQFKDENTINGAVKRYLLPKDSKLTECDIQNILDFSSTIILLDGYDECPDRGKDDTAIELINCEEMCQEYDVVLTTRTSCLPPDHGNKRNRLFRLCGFDEDSREKYIRNLVASDCPDVATKITKLIKENPVAADLTKIPLFFAMVCCMVNDNQCSLNMQTVTKLFGRIIKWFQFHKDNKNKQNKNKKKEMDHSKLDKIAFNGLSKGQQIAWRKEKLIDDIGEELYREYISIGILVEEEVTDLDNFESYTETRFFHKLFAEWYAANYVKVVAAQPETEFEPWRKRRRLSNMEGIKGSDNDNTTHLLTNLDPDDVNYLYRFACGLNGDAALKIIKHLGEKERYDKYTLLCITEWGGKLETIRETVTILSKLRERYIRNTDSFMLQKSTLAMIDFASHCEIPVDTLWLYDCLDDPLDSSGNLVVKPSNLTLPVLRSPLRKLRIHEYGRRFTEDETLSILQYSAKCEEVRKLEFRYCLLPKRINIPDRLRPVLEDVSRLVKWNPGSGDYILDVISGNWENRSEYTPITDKEYDRAKEVVDRYAEWRKETLETK